MKLRISWQVTLGIILIALSAAVYYAHYLIFHDAHHIFLYLVGDIAFVFLEVLLVTMVLHQLLHYREKKTMLNKLNMVIGAFYSEVGTCLLKSFSEFDTAAASVAEHLVVTDDWSAKEFRRICAHLRKLEYDIDVHKGDLVGARDLLREKRQFLLGLLENPNLLEHESFTNLLWAVFHLTEELLHRKDLGNLPETDYKHLAGDIKRVYRLLISEWLAYMQHLKSDYPYLFSLAMRTNPFDANATVEVC